ncbi:MAG: o-succinylbenzoate synthase [Acidobacteriota bacterium]|nr:MAG: o-succinylbenzoate synthase [Acidobacteriota bacterium]
MRIDRVILRSIRLPLLHFFETSFGRSYDKEALLLELQADGVSGWGECVSGEGPFYSYEDFKTSWYVLSTFLLPQLLETGWVDPESYAQSVEPIRGHPMAKATVESALWDLKARSEERPLWKVLGGTRTRIPCGVSIGIQDSVQELLEKIQIELERGYRKIKVKIKPGWDLDVLDAIRDRFGSIPLMADANSAYRLTDLETFVAMDRFELMMIEQPLYHDDIFEHASLQRSIRTPICLDESIEHARDASAALDLGSCRIINIKMGRVGGAAEARRIHDLCQARGIPVWCGGMLETGIGRAHNIALSTLENFSIPGDVSASRRYFERDTIQPAVTVDADGCIEVSDKPGIGFEPDLEFIDFITVKQRVFSPMGK